MQAGEVQAEDVLQQGVPGEGRKGGHKQECERLREGGEGRGGSGGAALQEALRAALLRTTRHATTDRLKRVFIEMSGAFDARKDAEVVTMAEEGQAVAGEPEVRRAWPHVASLIYNMLGASFGERCEYVKSEELLAQARALAVESGNRSVLGRVCISLGAFHGRQGDYEKAIKEEEQSMAICAELGDRHGEGVAGSSLGESYRALKQYDKAIELLKHSLAIFEELGDRSMQASTCRSLGVCLSRHGQHDRAVSCLKRSWAMYQELGDEVAQALAAQGLGIALWTRARDEHHQAAPDATSCGGASAASADTLQQAETWLRTALDRAVKIGWVNVRMGAKVMQSLQ